MRLDRNINADKLGKYALLRLRVFREKAADPKVLEAVRLLEAVGILDWGIAGSDSEFFVIRLKDEYAKPALHAYAAAASENGNEEFAEDVRDMASRAGYSHVGCKTPD